MYLTPIQLSRLRTRPHRTRLWLSIFRPRVVYETQISQSTITKGARDITVTALSGTRLDALAGMTVYVGTTQGSKDIGRIRLRSTTSTELILAENSITWINGWFLTVVRYFEPWGVFPRITLDSDNDPTFFKDYDIAYSNQNTVFDPVVCMGPNHAGMLTLAATPPGTGTHSVWYTSSGSFDPTPAGTLASYDWHFEGGDPTGSTAADPGYVQYTGCGSYVTSLAITTTDGATFTGRRHIDILARPEDSGSCKPINAWGLKDLSGDRDSGGYEANIWVREAVNPEDIVDGALVVVFSEDFEGGVAAKRGANAESRDTILFAGYILEDSIIYNPETSKVDFKVGGTVSRMMELSTFSTALDSVDNGEPWTVMSRMTVDRAVIHFLRWHSTVLSVADFSQTSDTKRVESINFDRGNVYDTVNQLLNSALVARMVSDRQGKLWSEIDSNAQPTGTSRQVAGHMQSVIEITRQDWRREVSIERNPDGDLAYLEMGGLAYSGVITGTSDAYLSGAPGEAPEYFGSAQRVSGLVIESQTQLNELTGLAWAAANPLYPDVTVPMAGDYRFLDIAPQHRVEMTLINTDTFRRITWSQKPFMPDSISYEYQPANQILLMELTLKEETSGDPGDTIIIPVDPPYDRPILPDWDIDFPPIVPPDPIEPPILPPEGAGGLVYVVASNRLTRTRNMFASGTVTDFEDITPQWDPSQVTGSFTGFRLDPDDPVNTAYLMTSTGRENFSNNVGPHLYRINNLDGITGSQTYTELMNPTLWASTVSPAGAGGLGGEDFMVSPVNTNVIMMLGSARKVPPNNRRVVCLRSADAGVSWSEVSNELEREHNDANQYKMKISDHSSVAAIALVAQSGAGDDRRVFQTTLAGNSWTQLYSSPNINALTEMHIPLHANSADRISYWSDFLTTSRRLYRADDLFATPIEISPIFDGDFWAVARTTSPGSFDAIVTWPGNRLLVAAMLQRSVAAGDHDDSAFFFASDGAEAAGSWGFRGHVFSNYLYLLDWHATNPLLLYALCDSAGDAEAIMVTDDQGFTWENKIDSWERDIGARVGGADLGWTPVAIRSVGIV